VTTARSDSLQEAPPATASNNQSRALPGATPFQLVYGRGRGRRADDSSILVWGVSLDTSALDLAKTLLSEINWGDSQPVVLQETTLTGRPYFRIRLRSALSRNTHYEMVREKAEKIGWRAVPSRNFRQRAKQRKLTKQPQPPSTGRTPEKGEEATARSLPTRESKENGKDNPKSSLPTREGRENVKDKKLGRVHRKNKRTSLKQRLKLRVGALNVDGGLFDNIKELTEHFKTHKYDIVGLSETRFGKRKRTPKVDDYVAHWLDNHKGSGGVGILVRTHISGCVTRETSTHANQLWVKIHGTSGERDMYVCATYMPQSNDTGAEEAYKALEASITKYASLGSILILGDMNARLGNPNSDRDQELQGKHCEGQENTNGTRLKVLLDNEHLYNLGGQAAPGPAEAYGNPYWFTRRDPRSGAQTAIDYIIVGRSIMATGPPTFGVDYTDLCTDHHLVWATLVSPRHSGQRTKPKKTTRILFEQLAQQETQLLFEKALQKEFGNNYDPSTLCLDQEDKKERAESVIANFVGRFLGALTSTVGTSSVCKGKSRSWYTSTVREAINARRAQYKTWRMTRSNEDHTQWVKLRATARKVVRDAKKSAWEKIGKDIEKAHAGDKRKFWKLLNGRLLGKGATHQAAVRRADGTYALDFDERMEAWAEYEERLFSPSEDPLFDANYAREVNRKVAELHEAEEKGPEKLEQDFTLLEVETCLKSLKNGKARGSDRVPNEALKAGGKGLAVLLQSLFNWLNTTEHLPKTWGTSVVFNLYKDGDPSDPSNYRGIHLISCLAKMYLTLWSKRLTAHMETKLGEEQGGFRPGRSTTDQAFTLHECLARRKRANMTSYVFFIDFKKAFDSVWHEGLLLKLHEQGVTGKAWRILRNLYSQVSCSVLVDGERSRMAHIRQGVRQGCPLSPLLFSCFVETLAVRLRTVGGVQLGSRWLHSLLYADDVAILADSPESLQSMLDVVSGFCREFRLKLNMSKSKILRVPPRPSTAPEEITATYQDETVEVVTEYKYLGLWFTQDLNWNRHIAFVVKKARKKIDTLAGFFGHKGISHPVKTKVWSALVQPRILYGTEITELTQKQQKILDGVVHQAGTKIMKTNRKAHRGAVRAILGLTDQPVLRAARVGAFHLKLQLMPNTRWPKHLANLPPQKSHLRGAGVPLLWNSRLSKLNDTMDNFTDKLKEIEEGLTDAASLRGCMRSWTQRQQGLNIRNLATQRSKAQLAASACLDDEGFAHPAPITNQPLTPTNRLRIRMLCGTSSLNADMNKIDHRNKLCPVCEESTETLAHFLLECPRRDFTQYCARATNACDCGKCAANLLDITPEESLLFLLGGSMTKTPCDPADAVSRRYFKEAWTMRVCALNKSDSSDSDSGSEPDIRNFLPQPLSSSSLSHQSLSLSPSGQCSSVSMSVSSVAPSALPLTQLSPSPTACSPASTETSTTHQSLTDRSPASLGAHGRKATLLE
jgi:exonuclease III